MSMLSAQSDELRTLANELEQFTEGCIGRTREEHVMLISSVDCMREAAVTIEGLRDRLKAKCDELEEEVAELREGFEETIEDYNESERHVAEIERVLLQMYLTWKRLDLEGDWPDSGHNGWKTFTKRLSDLGIEVDDGD